MINVRQWLHPRWGHWLEKVMRDFTEMMKMFCNQIQTVVTEDIHTCVNPLSCILYVCYAST